MRSSPTPTEPSGSSKMPLEVVDRKAANKARVARPTREVRNEADSSRNPNLHSNTCLGSLRGSSSFRLDEGADSAASGVQAAAAKTHSTLEWHGDFPSGRSRIALDRRHGSYSWRIGE